MDGFRPSKDEPGISQSRSLTEDAKFHPKMPHPAYHEDRAAQTFLRKVMALQYIPTDDIEMFNQLHEQANQNDSLLNLLQYVRTTWIYANRWNPTTWSVYRRNVHTNNDIEGWHNRINQQASNRHQIPFYELVKLLHKEAKTIDLRRT
ncbi:hypothetical protein AC249_AIPGENE4344 [Exaiptasia diaphana]|nr:hypothetical protein AC249_AIPGENE4344 [Exaiptasia diaphana]